MLIVIYNIYIKKNYKIILKDVKWNKKCFDIE